MVETAYLSLPLSPGQRSSYLAGVFAGSSFRQPPSSSLDPVQCVGMVPKHPITDMCEQDIRKVGRNTLSVPLQMASSHLDYIL